MQHDFAAEVVADLDLFLVLVGGVVYRIVTLRFKEEMANLAAGHRHRPSDQGRDRGVPEQQEPHENEADRAQKMKRLVNQAMVIVAVIVPTLNFRVCIKPLIWTSPFDDYWQSAANRPVCGAHAPAAACSHFTN